MVNRKKVSDKKLKITLSVNRKIFKEFSKYCKERGMKISPKVEIMMKKEISENK